MSVIIHREASAPEIIAGPLTGVPEYDEPVMLRWFEYDGERYWIETSDHGQRQGQYIVRGESDGETIASYFTLREIREDFARAALDLPANNP